MYYGRCFDRNHIRRHGQFENISATWTFPLVLFENRKVEKIAAGLFENLDGSTGRTEVFQDSQNTLSKF